MSTTTFDSPFDTVCIIGTGLLGGSVAAAMRSAGLGRRFLGLDLDAARVSEAIALRLVDAEVTDPTDCDLAVVAVPGPAIAGVVAAWSARAGLVIDVGSVKAPIAEATNSLTNFVPSHPMAGSERSGPEAARADLFEGQSVIVTPTAATTEAAVDAATGLWEALGAAVHRMSPADHDEAVSVTSHLPHLLAFVFAGLVEREHLPVTGPGFRDFTRIARSDPEVWSHILTYNRQRVLRQTDRYLELLTAAREHLAADDERFADWLAAQTQRPLR